MKDDPEHLRSFKVLMELALDGIFVCDADTLRFLYVNRGALDQVGYTVGQMHTMTPLDIKPDFDERAYRALIAPILAGSQNALRFETRHRHRDGTLIPVDVTMQLLQVGDDRRLVVVARDITEQKRAQARLERAEALNRAVLETAVDGVTVIDEAGAIQSFNPAAEKIFGWKAAEVIGKNVRVLMPEPYRAVHDGYLRSYVESGAKKIIGIGREVEGVRKDGSRFPLELGVSEMRVGEQRLFAGITRDVSDRRRAEQERDRFFTMAIDLLCIASVEGHFKRVNPAFTQSLGYSESELLRKPFIEFVHPDDVPGTLAEVEKLAAGATMLRFENRYRAADGLYRILQWSATPDPATGLLYAAARDITDLRRREQELVEKSRELEAAARVDRIAVRILKAFSTEQGSLRALRQAIEVLADEAGYRPLAFYLYEEWQGRFALEAESHLPPGFERRSYRAGEGLVGEAGARREAVFLDASGDGAFALDTGAGLIAPQTVFAVPLVHQERLLGVIAGAAPVRLGQRERGWLVQIAAQMAVGLNALLQYQALRDLSDQLNERTRRIDQQNAELERASRMKSEFLANMSHELRTPLNAILGFSELLKDGIVGDLDAKQADYVGEIFESGKHLLSLINDILDLSKIEVGKMELDFETIDLESLVANALTIVKERAAKEGVALERTIAPDLGGLRADGRKLRQIVYNLLSNAVKFTPRGGRVRVEATRAGDEVEIAVVDTGIGIPRAELPRLFTAFEQLDGGIARRFDGTGLGLVMVKRLAELHGGRVGVESEPGRGSRFWVRLPRREVAIGSAAGPEATAPAVRAAEGPLRASLVAPLVLAVDDDPAAIELLRTWIEKAGYAFEAAGGGRDAWAQIERRSPDVILLDIFLAQESGWDLLQRLRERPDTAAIPVVVVSITTEHAKGIALGAIGVLQKPVSSRLLLDAIAALGLSTAPSRAIDVLVVDDDPRAVEHIAKRLEASGFSVTRAYGGREACAAVAARPIRLVILDLIMPEVSGFEVIARLRSRPETADLPVIVLTAKQLTAAEQETLDRSVRQAFSKAGAGRDQLLAQVRLALGGSLAGSGGKGGEPLKGTLMIEDHPTNQPISSKRLFQVAARLLGGNPGGKSISGGDDTDG